MKFSFNNIKNNCILYSAGVFAGRPFVFCACISFLLLIICIFSNFYVRLSCLLLCILCGIYFIIRRKAYSKFGAYSRTIYVIAAFMSLILCARTLYHFDIRGAECEKFISDRSEITAYAVPDGNSKIMITSIDGEKVSYYATLYGAYLPDFYEEFTCFGKINTVKSSSLSDSTYRIGNNISFTVKAEEIHKSGELAKTPYAEFYKANRYIRSSIYKHCDEYPGMISGIFLGNRADIPSSVNADFLKTGISHIIAVSGLHVIAALALLSFILSKTVPQISIRALILIFAALFYALITGCVYSVMRAAVMYTVLNLSVVLFRKNDSVTSLFISLYLIFLFEPYALLSLSLQLSAVSTFGIVVFAAPLCKRIDSSSFFSERKGIKAIARYSVKSLIISASATLPLIPISAYYFGKVSLISPLMTLLISPFVLLILYAAPLTALLGFFDPLADLAGQMCDSCAEISIDLASFGAHHLNFEVSLEYVFAPFIILTFCILTAALILSGINKKRIYALLCTVFISVYSVSAVVYHFTRKTADEMIYSCVYDDVLCRVTGNRAVAVDITNGSASSYELLFSELRKRGILELDTLILTRCGENHVKLIRNLYADYGIENIILPEKDRYTEHVSVTAEELDIAYSFYDAESGFSSKSEQLMILPTYYPDKPRGCTVKWNGAVYTSGRTFDIDIQDTIPLFIYGTFSDAPKDAIAPIENTKLAIVPIEIKENMFSLSEFEEYSKFVNVEVFDGVTVADMRKYNE